MRIGVLAAAVTAVAMAVAGCSSGTEVPRDTLLRLRVPASVTVSARPVSGLGTVLTDGAGHTLYVFPPDAGDSVTCTGACAGTWPPLVLADGARPTAGKGVIAGDLGTLHDPNSGQQVVTYAGYPLYRYAGDVRAGTADGQALFLNGGPWYVVAPNGDPIVRRGSDS